MGVEYIWIDSLCIIQDSEDDWRMKSARMGDVYKYASCNIAATEAKDGESGLFTDRNDSEVDTVMPKAFEVEQRSVKDRAMSALWDICHGIHIAGEHVPHRLSPGNWIGFDQYLWENNITNSNLVKRG